MKKCLNYMLISYLASLSLAVNGQDFYTLDAPCNPISVITCALPGPSDMLAIEDLDSPTGMRLYYPEGAGREELFALVPPSLLPEKVANGSTGYSAGTAVGFELLHTPDSSTLPNDGGESVVAFNLDSGERVPIRANISAYAASKLVAEPSNIIEVYPRSRWEFGERYVVAISKSLKTINGSDHEISPGFTQAISNDGSQLANYHEPVIQFLEAKGYSRDDLVSATFFTIRDEQEVTGKLSELSEYVYNESHPIRNLRVRHKLFGKISAHVSGEVLVHNFRDEYGSMIYDVNGAEENWIKFRLTLPRAAKDKPVPVSIFSHGIGFIKESGISVAIGNAKLGIATIAIDHPNHGSRISADGGWVGSLLNTEDVPRQLGMMIQSSIDHMSLLKAIQTSLGELDVLPRRFWGPLVTREMNGGDGVPELDTNTVFFQGVSLGGVLGSVFVSLAPDIKGAILQVSGAGITSILSGSALWNPLFSRMVPDIATGAEALLLKTAMQHVIDYGDPLNFAHYFRNPIGIATPKPILIIAGEGDRVVPNFSTAAFAELADLPLIGEKYFALPTERQADFTDGYGVVELPKLNISNEFLNGFLVHFRSDRANAIVKDWIKRYILEEKP